MSQSSYSTNALSALNVGVPYDVASWDPARSAVTTGLLHFLHCRDPITNYIVDTVIEEAFRYGPVLPSSAFKLPPWVMPRFKHAAKYAWLYGVSALFLEDGTAPDMLTTVRPAGSKVHGLKPLHLTIGSATGLTIHGVSQFNVDDFNTITSLDYTAGKAVGTIRIDASRFVFMTGLRKDEHPFGHPVVEPLLDTIMSMKAWERASGQRAKQQISATHVIYRENAWSDSEITAMNKAVGATKVLYVDGRAVEVAEIGRGVSDAEIAQFQDQAWKNVSAGSASAQSDITGASAGQKLSSDKNSSIHTMKLETIQELFHPAADTMFEVLAIPGFTFDGWVDPREVTEQERFDELLQLLMTWKYAVDSGDSDMMGYIKTLVIDKLANAI